LPLPSGYGVVNRALPDAGLDAFVKKFAADVAGCDRQTLAEAKVLVDRATLPEKTDLVTAYDAFFARSPGWRPKFKRS
jgi:hypothetical protein